MNPYAYYTSVNFFRLSSMSGELSVVINTGKRHGKSTEHRRKLVFLVQCAMPPGAGWSRVQLRPRPVPIAHITPIGHVTPTGHVTSIGHVTPIGHGTPY